MRYKHTLKNDDLKVLGVILRLAGEGKPITVLSILDKIEWASYDIIRGSIHQLLYFGLVEKIVRGPYGTIRPTCQFIPANRLGET